MAMAPDSECTCGCMEEVVRLRDELAALKEQVRELVDIAKGKNASAKKTDGTKDNDGASMGKRGGMDSTWKVAKGRGNNLVLKRERPPVTTQNRFSCLQTQKSEQLNPKVDASNKEVIVVGSSRVRHMGKEFGMKNPKRRTAFCFPGAKVRDIADRVGGLIEGRSEGTTVFTVVGSNDIGTLHSEETYKAYKDLVKKLKESRCRGVVTSILPRISADDEWSSRALSLNCRVAKLCESEGVVFLDLWDRFWGRDELYGRDGLHFSYKGVQTLSNSFEDFLKSDYQGN